MAGTAYAFQPVAADPEGARLSFAIQNRPSWASFDGSTGRLGGTPGAAHVGSYGNISISVTDGSTFSSLAPFGVEVRSAPNNLPGHCGLAGDDGRCGPSVFLRAVCQRRGW